MDDHLVTAAGDPVNDKTTIVFSESTATRAIASTTIVATTGEQTARTTGAPDTGYPPISQEKYDELVLYFKYASSCYVPVCPRPCGNKLVSTISNPMTDIQGFIARDDTRKELIVALRGSASVVDIILDAQILTVPILAPGIKAPSGTKVHAGFLAAWDSVALQVIMLLRAQLRLHPDTTAIVTTGHSLGGALALLCALSAAGSFPSKTIRTYSYGAPRTGNATFAKFVQETLGDRAHRVVHGNDGVPTMIPAKLGYHHHGVEYWQHSKPACSETTVQCDPEGEDPKCSRSIPSKGVTLAHTNYFGILVSTPFCL